LAWSGTLVATILVWPLSRLQASPPPGGNYNGVYIGGSPGTGHGGDSGYYLGGYGSYRRGYDGVYIGGNPDTSRYYGIEPNRETEFLWPYRPAEYLLDSHRALIELRVPRSAELWFQGQEFPGTGSVRMFVSPVLEPGEKYSYSVRARWSENGKTKEETRKVPVHAGDRVYVQIPDAAQKSLPGSAQVKPRAP
jgi:uncharacterized protein (TIGR03000 family)